MTKISGENTRIAISCLAGATAVIAWGWLRNTATAERRDECDDPYAVLPCIRNRRSVFPRSYLKDPPQPVDTAIIQSLLDAALWGPFHGRCYAGHQHPAKFVVLDKQAMNQMQEMTLKYYDRNWRKVGWGCGSHSCSSQDYQDWRKRTEEEISGRWGPCSFMIGIVMRRQSGPKRLPEWEEAAAVAAAVQNMHIQSTKFSSLACYWSSWHDAARESDEMKAFLNMKDEDKCLGFFIVAQQSATFFKSKDRRKRDRSILEVEWRTDIDPTSSPTFEERRSRSTMEEEKTAYDKAVRLIELINKSD